jgi:CBS domain-containing protein
MKCNDVATGSTEGLSTEDTIDTAAERMDELGVGFLPICDAERRVVGVITDRDIVVRAVAKLLDARSTKVTAIMSQPPITCRFDADLHLAEELMEEQLTARVVLTEPDGTLAACSPLPTSSSARLAVRRCERSRPCCGARQSARGTQRIAGRGCSKRRERRQRFRRPICLTPAKPSSRVATTTADLPNFRSALAGAAYERLGPLGDVVGRRDVLKR